MVPFLSYRGCCLAKLRNFRPGAVNSWTVISDSWRRKLTVDALKVKNQNVIFWNLNICCPSNKSESNNFTLIWWNQIKKKMIPYTIDLKFEPEMSDREMSCTPDNWIKVWLISIHCFKNWRLLLPNRTFLLFLNWIHNSLNANEENIRRSLFWFIVSKNNVSFLTNQRNK